MLKIVKEKTTVTETPDLQQGWALVRTSPKEAWKSIPVPFTIGSQSDNDIFVNAPTMRALSKIIVERQAQLVSVDAQTSEISSLDQLRLFGIECLGPFSQNPETLSFAKRMLAQFLVKELAVYTHKAPAIIKKYLPAKQKPRILILSSAILVGLIGLQSLSFSPDLPLDLSKTPLSVPAGNIVSLGIQSANASQAYAHGATVLLTNGEELKSEGLYVLTLNLWGLDQSNELSINFNGKLVAETQAIQACVDAVCPKDITIDAALVSSTANTIKITHNAPNSSYGINSIFFRKMEPATDEEKELTNQLLVSADRYYDERLLLVKNIKNALESITEAEHLMNTKTGLEAFKSKFILTRKKVQDGFKETSSDLQFKLQKELKLGHAKQAVTIIDDMLKLYPDPATKQYMMLMSERKKLTEVAK